MPLFKRVRPPGDLVESDQTTQNNGGHSAKPGNKQNQSLNGEGGDENHPQSPSDR